jgi:hypothetical protein
MAGSKRIESIHPQALVPGIWLALLFSFLFAIGYLTRTSLVCMLLLVFFLKGARDSMAGDVHHRYLIPFHISLFFLFSRCEKYVPWTHGAKGAKESCPR